MPNELNCVLSKARLLSQTLTNHYNLFLRNQKCKLESTQIAILKYIKKKQYIISIKQLSAAIQVNRTTMARNLIPLIKGKWILTGKSTLDGRRTKIVLNPEREAEIEEAIRLYDMCSDDLVKLLGVDLCQDFIEIVDEAAGILS